MPIREIAAKRYAQAVFAIASDDDSHDRWLADLRVLESLTDNTTVQAFLRSAKVGEPQKHEILNQALAELNPKVLNLAKLLIRKSRSDIVGQIAEEFESLLNLERGIALSRVTTAVPLTDESRQIVREAIQKITGSSRVNLDERVDSELVGGIVVQIGDHIIDGSVRTRLSGLRRTVATGAS